MLTASEAMTSYNIQEMIIKAKKKGKRERGKLQQIHKRAAGKIREKVPSIFNDFLRVCEIFTSLLIHFAVESQATVTIFLI